MRSISLITLALVAGCGVQPMTPERAARYCEDRARAAQGPTGRVTVGINSNSGPYLGGEIGVTSDYIQGRDPMAVYEACVYERTGGAPIRAPNLR